MTQANNNSRDWFFLTYDLMDPPIRDKMKRIGIEPKRHLNADGSLPVYDRQGNIVCIVQATTDKKALPSLGDLIDSTRDQNARLISAAPRMFAILKSFADEFQKLAIPKEDISTMLELIDYVEQTSLESIENILSDEPQPKTKAFQ